MDSLTDQVELTMDTTDTRAAAAAEPTAEMVALLHRLTHAAAEMIKAAMDVVDSEAEILLLVQLQQS